jgi:hypothetical protein
MGGPLAVGCVAVRSTLLLWGAPWHGAAGSGHVCEATPLPRGGGDSAFQGLYPANTLPGRRLEALRASSGRGIGTIGMLQSLPQQGKGVGGHLSRLGGTPSTGALPQLGPLGGSGGSFVFKTGEGPQLGRRDMDSRDSSVKGTASRNVSVVLGMPAAAGRESAVGSPMSSFTAAQAGTGMQCVGCCWAVLPAAAQPVLYCAPSLQLRSTMSQPPHYCCYYDSGILSSACTARGAIRVWRCAGTS